MSLVSGTRIGNYEVVTPQGAGGMGEVYRARDTRLDRTVAIKSLPPVFATDPERLARFEAPMIDAARHALFKEVRIESGMPQGSDLLASGRGAAVG